MHWQKSKPEEEQKRRRQGHPGVRQHNILSVTLSSPSSSFSRQGLLGIFGYLAFFSWPSTNKYKLWNLYRGLSYDELHHFLFSHPSFTRCWPNKDINISLHPGSNLWGADSLRRGNRKRVWSATSLSAPCTVKVSWTVGHTVCLCKNYSWTAVFFSFIVHSLYGLRFRLSFSWGRPINDVSIFCLVVGSFCRLHTFHRSC